MPVPATSLVSAPRWGVAAVHEKKSQPHASLRSHCGIHLLGASATKSRKHRSTAPNSETKGRPHRRPFFGGAERGVSHAERQGIHPFIHPLLAFGLTLGCRMPKSRAPQAA